MSLTIEEAIEKLRAIVDDESDDFRVYYPSKREELRPILEALENPTIFMYDVRALAIASTTAMPFERMVERLNVDGPALAKQNAALRLLLGTFAEGVNDDRK